MTVNDEARGAGSPSPNEAILHDIIIVGAGPCGLATAARLREQNPAAIFTDEEHRRFHWMRRHGHKMAHKHVDLRRASGAADATRSSYNMVVLDADHDSWMGRWNKLFRTFDIKHLRSPMFWHVDPNDRDSLLSKACESGREKELIEIRHCVGNAVGKHMRKRNQYVGGKNESRVPINERDRIDYFNPSQALFCDHCDEVVGRYGLQPAGLVRKERVLDISYDRVPGISFADEKLFTVRTDQGIRYSPIVIMAVGPGNQPRIPDIPGITTPSTDGLPPTSHPPGCQTLPPPQAQPPQTCHAMHIREFPDPTVKQRISAQQPTNVLIIGGGLTSAQLADLAIRRGVTTVWHMTRGPLRVKHFDVDLAWMGKLRNVEQARFWQADSDAERLAILRGARGGGSVTPRYHEVLKGHVASGRLKLFERTKLVGARFEEGRQGRGGVWHVQTCPDVEGLPPMDYIYFATGVETDFEALPYLQTMLGSHPIAGHGGFPCLNDHLMWKDGVPLFMAGRLAALKLGPSAPNLGGARLAAERIARGIEEVVRRECRVLHGGQDSRHDGERDEDLMSYVAGTGNMFRSLAEVPS